MCWGGFFFLHLMPSSAIMMEMRVAHYIGRGSFFPPPKRYCAETVILHVQMMDRLSVQGKGGGPVIRNEMEVVLVPVFPVCIRNFLPVCAGCVCPGREKGNNNNKKGGGGGSIG